MIASFFVLVEKWIYSPILILKVCNSVSKFGYTRTHRININICFTRRSIIVRLDVFRLQG